MKMTGSLTSMAIIFSILAFGPRLANMAGLFGELLINAACIFVLLFLGCHNIMMSNHSTIVLGYLFCTVMTPQEKITFSDWQLLPQALFLPELFFTEITTK